MLQDIRHNWTLAECEALYHQPFTELVFQAQQKLREHFAPNQVQLCRLYNIQVGACPEDCKYCAQSVHYQTDVSLEKHTSVDELCQAIDDAKSKGATRFCMSASVRRPSNKILENFEHFIEIVKSAGMECCVTTGLLDAAQTARLKAVGLDYYNHNIDTSPEYYQEIISTRDFQDRLNTIAHVQEAGIKVCSGGILGMGETVEDRLKMLMTLANLDPHPQSVPVNQIIPVPGTPMADKIPVDTISFVRTIAVARLMMPSSYIRLSGHRKSMSDDAQTMCFLAGANSIFVGDILLTRQNATPEHDKAMLNRLGLTTEPTPKYAAAASPAPQQPKAIPIKTQTDLHPEEITLE